MKSLIGKFRDEFLNGELFFQMCEATVLIERWRKEYNTIRPYRFLNSRPPGQEAILPKPLIPGQTKAGNFCLSLT